MYKTLKYFEKGQPHECDYCTHETARISPAYFKHNTNKCDYVVTYNISQIQRLNVNNIFISQLIFVILLA